MTDVATRPNSADETADDAGSSEWQAVYDENSQAWYWWNTVSGETTWEDPNGIAKEEAGKGQVEEEEGEEESNDEKEEGEAEESKDTKEDGKGEQSTTAAADYYSSEAYYNWYYSQMGMTQQAADGTAAVAPAAPAGANAAAAAAAAAYSTYQAYNALSMPAIALGNQNQPSTAGFFGPGDISMSATFNAKTGKFQPDRSGGESYFNPSAKAERQMAHFFDIDRYQEERNLMKLQEAMMPQGKKKLTKKDIDKFKKKNKEKKLRSLLKRFGPDD
ncbi:hypothetical protein HDU97_007841 [Phlyctochytrium planicorne]|nr:hypothetical protein HDU97_007841 [Phlyctochytrium planicorne]